MHYRRPPTTESYCKLQKWRRFNEHDQGSDSSLGRHVRGLLCVWVGCETSVVYFRKVQWRPQIVITAPQSAVE